MSASSNLAHLYIPIFPGQEINPGASKSWKNSLLDVRTTPGGVLLSTCHQAFHSEISVLSSIERQSVDIDLSDFQNPESLLALPHNRYLYNPAISQPTLLLKQVLRYLAFIEDKGVSSYSLTPFTDVLKRNAAHGVGIIGYSSGILAACVIGTSVSSIQFITHALEAFRLSIWIGIRLKLEGPLNPTTISLEQVSSSPLRLVALGTDEQSTQTIEDLNRRFDESAPHVSMTPSDTRLATSTRTNILDSFCPSASTSTSPVRKTSNVPSDFSAIVEKVTKDVDSRGISLPTTSDIWVPIRAPVSGKLISKDSLKTSLVVTVLDVIFAETVNSHDDEEKVYETVPHDVVIYLLNAGPGDTISKMIERRLSPRHVESLDLGNLLKNSQLKFKAKQEPIAIVGMAVNMPGAPNSDKLWEVLEKGINTISQIPEHRFRVSDYLDGNDTQRSMKAHTGNFIDGADEFDNKFFKISPREAKSMDPQQRLLLHTAYEALEDSGYVPNATPTSDPENFGCFIGVATHDYLQNLRNDIDVYYSTGTLKAFLSGRLSYAMQLGGPSVVIDTACSSSTVAIYQGARALMNNDCNAALVGGVNVISSPDMFLGLDRGHFLSPTGQCKAFDETADGYSRSEGCGIFILKRLSDAVAEKDNILGVVRGIEVNQSGQAHSITHPHAPTQARLFKQVLENSGIQPDRVNVVEAHGTGTQAGDPNEVESIRSVFSSTRSSKNPLHITSVKSSIGHLEAASGAAGLAKLLLMLQHGTIPKQISLKRLNPRIKPLEDDNTVIDTVSIPWRPSHEGMTRIALLNNFGAAGSNTALLLEEHLRNPSKDPEGYSHVFALSAKDRDALEKLRRKYLDWLEAPESRELNLTDIAYSMTARRQVYAYRLAVVASNRKELAEKLSQATTSHVADEVSQVVFVFSGEGSQHMGMGRSLYKSSPKFQSVIKECDNILTASGFSSILPIVTAENSNGLSTIEELEAFHTSLFSLEYALSRLWISWGVKPVAVVGYGLGEYAALVNAEVLTLKDALLTVANRARLVVQCCALKATGMITINLDPIRVQSILENSKDFEDLMISCYNSSASCTVSGAVSQLQKLKLYLATDLGRESDMLNVPFGFYSLSMEPMLTDLTNIVRDLSFGAPTIPVISSVMGRVIQPGDRSVFNAEYLARHCVQPIRFSEGLSSFVSSKDVDYWLEVGPDATTLAILKSNDILPRSSVLLESLQEQKETWLTLTSTLSRLYLSNIKIKWRDVFSHIPSASCISLPTYPFSKSKFWVPFKEDKVKQLAAPRGTPSTEYSILQSWIQYPSVDNQWTAKFKTPISRLAIHIGGHRVGGVSLCPASVYIEQVFAGVNLAMSHMQTASNDKHIAIRGMEFARPLVYDENISRTVITSITMDNGCGTFSVSSIIDSSFDESIHVHGEFRLQHILQSATKFSRVLPVVNRQMGAVIRADGGKLPDEISKRTVYEVIFPRVVDYSKNYHTIRSIVINSSGMESKAQIKLPEDYDRRNYVVHPVFTDTLLHVAGFVANMQGDAGDAYICSEVGSIKIIPRLVENDATYSVYSNCSWLQDQGVMLAESYAVKMGKPNVIVAHMKDIHFRKVRLVSLKKSFAHAAGKTGSVVLSNPRQDQQKPRGEYSKTVVSSQKPVPRDKAPSSISSSSSGASSPRTLTPDDRSSGSTPFVIDGEPDVKQILAMVLDVDVNDVADSTDLVDLGLDSLTSIEALQSLKSTFKFDLPGNFFEKYATVQQIQEYLSTEQRVNRKAVVSRSTKIPEPRAVAKALEIAQTSVHRLIKALRLDTIPTPIQTTTNKRLPLFLIHDGSGLTNYYDRLSPMDRNIWGISNPHFATAQPWSSVTEMAIAYADYIQNTSSGPVIIGGWSFGGVAAYETSLQLAKRGVIVKGILLIDSPSPINHVPLSDSLIDSVVKLDARSATSELGRLVKTQFAMNARMLGKYDPRATGGRCPPLVLLRSSEGYNPEGVPDVPIWLADRSDPKIATAGWENLAGTSVPVLDIPGHHFTPFRPSNIGEVSRRIMEGCALLEK